MQIYIDIPANVRVAAALRGGAEHEFLSILDNFTVKEDKQRYPESIFLFKGDRMLIEIEKLKWIWCSHDLLWSKIERYFGGGYSDTQRFIKGMVEKHFRLKDVTPADLVLKAPTLVEKHFRLKGVIPHNPWRQGPPLVEEHFKLKDVTPEKHMNSEMTSVEEHFRLKSVTPMHINNIHVPEVEEHFRLKDVAPEALHSQIITSVEEHFKLNDVTPDKNGDIVANVNKNEK